MHKIRHIYLYRILTRLEKIIAAGLGKGYGAASLAQETRLLLNFLDNPGLAIDIGANTGEYTAKLRSLFPATEIHLFEPSALNQEKLRKRFDGAGSIILNQLALSDLAGDARLYYDTPGSGLGSLSKRDLSHFNIPFNLSEAVRTMRFEDYWTGQLRSRDIDLAKIDVEGHELSVLAGFGAAIRRTRVIQFEFGGCNLDTRTFFRDFWYFFKDHDFKMYRVTPFGLQPLANYAETEETFLTTNYLCINKASS
ncbi:FkbM family methyltransferase [Mucilaginibacter sp. AW1-7]|uniref:FkbM family methyltransferase n=1 Tax=Mucilaginibacter sp. AW1-7 TaxID=3349874 RepID=UPI003F73609A